MQVQNKMSQESDLGNLGTGVTEHPYLALKVECEHWGSTFSGWWERCQAESSSSLNSVYSLCRFRFVPIIGKMSVSSDRLSKFWKTMKQFVIFLVCVGALCSLFSTGIRPSYLADLLGLRIFYRGKNHVRSLAQSEGGLDIWFVDLQSSASATKLFY